MGLRKAYNCWTVSYATIGDWFAVCAAFLLTDPPQDSTGLGAKSAVYSWLIGVCRSSRARCTWPRGSATSTTWCCCCSTARMTHQGQHRTEGGRSLLSTVDWLVCVGAAEPAARGCAARQRRQRGATAAARRAARLRDLWPLHAATHRRQGGSRRGRAGPSGPGRRPAPQNHGPALFLCHTRMHAVSLSPGSVTYTTLFAIQAATKTFHQYRNEKTNRSLIHNILNTFAKT